MFLRACYLSNLYVEEIRFGISIKNLIGTNNLYNLHNEVQFDRRHDVNSTNERTQL